MNIAKEAMMDMYLRMVRIREFENKAQSLFAEGKIPGFVHLYLGEEAVATGVCECLRDDDYITSTHRGHGHIIAKGGDLKYMMAELFGKATGYCKGKGGSMHIADRDRGILGANGIVGAGHNIAVGAGLSASYRGTDQVCACFFGDGATNEGTFHESLNMAAAWKLPVVWFIENNCYGVSTEIHRVTNTPDLATRAAAYGVEYAVVDGTDPVEVYEAMCKAMEHARSGKGPYVLEAKVFRYQGHYCGDPAVYRPAEYMEEALKNDPIDKLGARLKAMGVKEEELAQIHQEAKAEMDEAVKFSDESPYPDPATVLDDMYVSDNERCVAR